MLALTQGKLTDYLYYQPMALFLAAAVALALHQRPLRRFRKALWAYVGAVLALDLALYALRLGDIFLA